MLVQSTAKSVYLEHWIIDAHLQDTTVPPTFMFRDCNFSDGASPIRVDMRNVKVEGSRFERATMWEVDLSGARLRGCRLNYAQLMRAKLVCADLTFAG